MNFNKDTIDQLSKLSDEQLTAELRKQLQIKKANGTLGDVEKMVKMISPFLTSEQKTRLAKIIQNIQASED